VRANLVVVPLILKVGAWENHKEFPDSSIDH
jgi:hypothetical protein